MKGLINRLRDFLGAIGDRVVIDGGDFAQRLIAALRWPFDRIGWALQRWLIWPVGDRLPPAFADRVPRPEGAGRALLAAAGVALAAAVGVGGLLLISSQGSGRGVGTQAAAPAAPIAKIAPPQPKAPPAPTLHGAAPDFKPAGKKVHSSAGYAPPTESPPAAASGTASSSAATKKISSTPSAQSSPVPSPPAGPAAIAVARRFANAFVVYETGGKEPSVRNAFGETATQELTRALLKRPPRLPSNVKVPRAKVVNVVAGPSRGPVSSVSVSLLRVGVTSELRLAMQRQKDRRWRVTDVLG